MLIFWWKTAKNWKYNNFVKFDNFSKFYKIYQIWKGWFSSSRYQKNMIETAFESWKDVFFYKKIFFEKLWFFLHLVLLYCTTKRFIKPKMCITMIFITFDDFLTFDNIQKKVNWGFSASSYRKSMIEKAFESWNTLLLQKKNFIEKFWFFF